MITDHQPLVRLMNQLVLTRVQTRWLRLGLFQSIRPTIKYQLGKANVVADAFNHSQRSTTKDSTVELAKNNPSNEVYVLTSVTVDPSEEDLKIWHQAYLEDLSTKIVFQQLRQRQMTREHSLTSHGLLGVQRGDVQKIVVPKSLRQQILKQCHDVSIVGHVGMRRTMELVDQQFHGRNIRGDTIQYVKTCPTCQLMKSDNRAKVGLLQPLEIPTKKCVHVTTNLVTDLLASDGYTAIAVFVNKLTKMIHFVQCQK